MKKSRRSKAGEGKDISYILVLRFASERHLPRPLELEPDDLDEPLEQVRNGFKRRFKSFPDGMLDTLLKEDPQNIERDT